MCVRFRAKAPRYEICYDAHGWRIPLGGVVLGPFSMLGLQVKTVVRYLRSVLVAHRVINLAMELKYPLGASCWRLRACHNPGVKLLQLWHGVARRSPIPYT